MLLEGQSIVVTGGNTGIGKAIVLAAAAEGANVVVDYIMHPEYAAEIIAAAERSRGCAVGVEADVLLTEDLHRVIRTTVETFGRLDVLVSKAGIETRTSLLETSEADFDMVLAVNLKGVFFGAQFAARQFMAQRSGGLIVTISSTHEDWPMPGNIAYCVAKGGAKMLTRTAGSNWDRWASGSSTLCRRLAATPINAVTTGRPPRTTAGARGRRPWRRTPRGLLMADGQGDAAAVQIDEAAAAKPHHPLRLVAERLRDRCGDEHSICGRIASHIIGCGCMAPRPSSTSRSWIDESQKG